VKMARRSTTVRKHRRTNVVVKQTTSSGRG
jgi:hypothetical protein